MTGQLRTITDDERADFDRFLARAFGETMEDGYIELRRPAVETERTFVVDEGDRWVASSGAYSMEVTVPGGAILPMAGVTAVSVRPDRRRRGLLTTMIDRLHEQARERGEPVAGLLASEASIYGRFGYGVATWVPSVRIAGNRSLHELPDDGGTVEMVELDRIREPMAEVFERARAARAGQVARRPGWVDRALFDADKGADGAGVMEFAVSRDADGVADGYASWRFKESWPDNVAAGKAIVKDLVAASPAARLRLHCLLCSLDLIESVEIELGDPADPLPHALVNSRCYRTTLVSDMLWLRVLDVARCFGSRSYEADGALTIDIVGDEPESGAWTIEIVDGRATVERSSAAPGLRIPISTAGSLLLGGTRPGDLAAAGRIEVLDPSALAVAQRIFLSVVPPFCQTGF